MGGQITINHEYLAGLFDAVGRVWLHPRPLDHEPGEYQLEYRLEYHLTTAGPVAGMLDEYFENEGISHAVYAKQGTDGYAIEILTNESIRK